MHLRSISSVLEIICVGTRSVSIALETNLCVNGFYFKPFHLPDRIWCRSALPSMFDTSLESTLIDPINAFEANY